MSKLTFKIKHDKDFSAELVKARQVAEFALKTRLQSSKHVKHIGLKSQISNQILKKYSRNKKLKKVKSVKLTIPGQGILNKNNKLYISSLKLEFDISHLPNFFKVCQAEVDNQYVYICCECEDEPLAKSDKFIGVDRNATGHIAVCALENKIYKLGSGAQHTQIKYKNIRKRLQNKRKFKLLKKISNKQARITKDINHKVSRKIADLAKQNKASIKLEDLKGIRKQKSKGKVLNRIISNWSFYQLATFVAYKAKLLGVDVIYVDPRNTSKMCSKCGLVGTRDKKTFSCEHCSHVDHADANAAFNIAKAPAVHRTARKNQLNKDRDLFKRTTDSLKGTNEAEAL